MQETRKNEIRKGVRRVYGEIAEAGAAGCGCSCGCGTGDNPTAEDIAVRLGYSRDDVSTAPQGANMGLGCGNPQAIASLQPGETVLDLGSGGGFDCFLAAKAVGQSGHVIGVDMTPEMVSKARENAVRAEIENVEFRLGEIENLPAADSSVDAVISNCVINLSPEKPKVFREASRVLKQGGRLAVTDIVATVQLPDEVKQNLALHASCVAGASPIGELELMLKEAGFTNIYIRPLDGSRELIREWTSDRDVGDYVLSATIEAVKPQIR
jgi:SAM-dependent methyltransferase